MGLSWPSCKAPRCIKIQVRFLWENILLQNNLMTSKTCKRIATKLSSGNPEYICPICNQNFNTFIAFLLLSKNLKGIRYAYSCSQYSVDSESQTCLFCQKLKDCAQLTRGDFLLMLNVPVNNFSVMSGRSHLFLGITSTFLGVNVSFFNDTIRRR